MKKFVKVAACVILSVIMALSFASCSSTKMTEKNVIETVSAVETALKEFDTEALNRYVSSTTLDYIVKLSASHEQFAKLGKAMFADLELEVKSVDTENQTVTISVSNKKLNEIASIFTEGLKSNYSNTELLRKLNDDSFLNNSLNVLLEGIKNSKTPVQAEITVKVEKGKKNLVLALDETAEDAVSGGALGAIKKIYS
ncbi:hypothetical protein [uncultured Eubacterium sp.]|uniref:hypothetical protein n=1 Tax=uncultured Eubacterium sp. TaxID=165185 RepID=UPI0015AAA29C|nr:hypothetical protein [uncultured Eubacterium sp.]